MTSSRKSGRSGDGHATGRAAPQDQEHKWEFKARFRRHAFGWKSQPAITRIKQAVAEIKKVASAVSVGLLALHWLVQGYGYEITSADVWDAYRSTLAAAERLGRAADVKSRIREVVAAGTARRPGLSSRS